MCQNKKSLENRRIKNKIDVDNIFILKRIQKENRREKISLQVWNKFIFYLFGGQFIYIFKYYKYMYIIVIFIGMLLFFQGCIFENQIMYYMKMRFVVFDNFVMSL